MANTKNMIEFKNRIYKFETISELNLVNIKNEKKFFKKIVKDYSYFKEKEIRKRIIHLYYKLMKKGIFS